MGKAVTRWSEADLALIQRRFNPPLEPTVVTAVRKYRNVRVEADGHTFDSKAEAARYWQLRLQQKAGAIEALEVHPKFDLHVCGVHIGSYVGDFAYRVGIEYIVEDVKQPATRTPIYRWKKKHMAAEHGIEIREVTT